jgi:TPR repeat protein
VEALSAQLLPRAGVTYLNPRSTHSAPVLHSFTTDPALAVVGNKPTKACDLNFSGGCYNLGFVYEKGKGVKQDDFKALKFYQKACDLNNGTNWYNGFNQKTASPIG